MASASSPPTTTTGSAIVAKYKFILEKYPPPHVAVESANDSGCWCFQKRFLTAFENQLRISKNDQDGTHLLAREGEETLLEFDESLVLNCETYSEENYTKANRPRAGVKHSLALYYFPKKTVERKVDELTILKSDYPESILIVYPSNKIQKLVEWYVNNVRLPKPGRNLFAYNVKDEYWVRKYQYIGLEQSHVYGLDDKFDMFERDFNIIHQKIDKLHKVGKSCSLNYFLHGPPGTGKSSFARAIATKYNLDIYTANLKDCQHIKDSDSVKSILTPSKIIFKQTPKKNEEFSENEDDCNDRCLEIETVTNPKQDQYYVVLIEDFDRYLDSCTANEMSNILNSIDGVEPSDGVIRFFSANNTEDIKLNKAFLSRMNGVWYFNLNDKESIKKRVFELFETPLYTQDSDKSSPTIQELYTEKASDHKLSLREITNHLIRFLMDEVNGIRSALEDIDRFVAEKDIKVERDEVVLNSTPGESQE